MTAGLPLLTVDGLRAGYGSVEVLFDVTLDIAAGEIIGLAGLNGAGKTTALRAISGVLVRTSGTVILDGQPLPAQPNIAARRGVSHVPEGRCLFRDLTVADNLRFGSVAARRSSSRPRQDAVLGAFPRLTELMQHRAGHLSGGEQQMLAIARGLMADPRVLLVDELSLGLSPKAVLDISAGLVDVARRESLALLLVDQNITLLRSICDRLYLLRDGATRVLSNAEQARTLEDAYF